MTNKDVVIMNKADIRELIGKSKLKKETIYIDAWNTNVNMIEMNGEQFIYASQNALVDGNMLTGLFFSYVILLTLLDTNDERIFSDDEIDVVKSLSADIYQKLMMKVMELNNIQEKN